MPQQPTELRTFCVTGGLTAISGENARVKKLPETGGSWGVVFRLAKDNRQGKAGLARFFVLTVHVLSSLCESLNGFV